MKNNSIHTVRDDMHASTSNYSMHTESEKFEGKKETKLDHTNTPYNPIQDLGSKKEHKDDTGKVKPTSLEDKESPDADDYKASRNHR